MARRGLLRKTSAIIADVTAPSISGLAAAGVTGTTATITFSTDEGAVTQLQYDTNSGFTAPVTLSATGTYKTSHSYGLTGLTLDTTYYFRARATDINTNQSAYTDSSNFVTTAGGEAWSDTGSLTGISGVALNLGRTFEKVDIEVLFTEDTPGTLDSVSVEYRISPDGSTLTTEDLHIVRPSGGQAAAYGAIMFLTEDTSYDVRVTLHDDASSMQKAGTITTRAESEIPAASSLSPTYYISATGSDAAAGTIGAPWLTLNKWRTTAPANSTAQIGSGWFAYPTAAVTTGGLKLRAQNLAVDTSGDINASPSGFTYLYSGAMSGPSGATETHLKGTASQCWTVHDAPNGIYKWAKAGANGHGLSSNPQRLLAAASLDPSTDAWHELAYWKFSASFVGLDTVANWITLVTTNQTYNYGFWVESSTGDIYARFPPNAPDQNPQNCYVTPSASSGFTQGLLINAANCRLSGLVYVGGDVGCYMQVNATGCVNEHFLSLAPAYGARSHSSTAGTFAADQVFQYFRIVGEGTVQLDATPSNTNVIPWNLIKSNILKADGTTFGTNTISQRNETSAIQLQNAGKRTVIRYGKVRNYFNGVGARQTDSSRYCAYATDIHDVEFDGLSDDAIEPENNIMNLACWNITANNCLSVLSFAPVNYGPVYLRRWSSWRCGGHMTISVANGSGAASGGGRVFKPGNSSASAAPPLILIEHGTAWTDTLSPAAGSQPSTGCNGISSGSWSATLATSPHIRFRNVIMRVTRKPMDHTGNRARLDDDYNLWVTDSAAHGVDYGSTYTTNVDAYRTAYTTATGRTNANTNLLNGSNVTFVDEATVDALFTDPTNGDLTLVAGTNHAVDAGVVIPNVSDTYSGSAPDLGKTERS